jgi:intracellular multiplication protein IcmB
VQLLTLTLGPIELWAFSTTAEDAAVRNQLYRQMGPAETRRFLALLFPSGSITKELNERLNAVKEEIGMIQDENRLSVISQLVQDILDAYSRDPNSRSIKSVTSTVT